MFGFQSSVSDLTYNGQNGHSSHGYSNHTSGYSLHPLQGNKVHGTHRKGMLYKKCESKMRRKQWQKRKCEVLDGFLTIAHNDVCEATHRRSRLSPLTSPVAICLIDPLSSLSLVKQIAGKSQSAHVSSQGMVSLYTFVPCPLSKYEILSRHYQL